MLRNARSALFLAGAASILSAGFGLPQAMAAAEGPAGSFSPPATPMTLTRVVIKPLPDGKRVMVARTYKIRFSRIGDRFRVEGEAIATEVEAPPVLAALADLERNRKDSGGFPFVLDANGVIKSRALEEIDTEHARKSIAAANQIIAKRAAPDPVKRETSTVSAQLAMNKRHTAWPDNLFNPGTADHVETREVALPDGTKGTVEVRIHAEGRLPGGLAQRVERTVTTNYGGTSRQTFEIWTITN